LTPADLISHAAENDVQAIALTDHDDIAGLKEASLAAKKLNIIFINGVEISVTWNKRTLHIVGLNFDMNNKPLFEGLKKIRDGRFKRAQLMANSLGMAGIQGAMDGAKSYAKSSTIGRIHFAQFLVAQGHAKNISAVFKKFLTPGKPGYVDHEWISLEESIRLINDAGGDAIIAHPGRYDMGSKLYPRLFQEFKDLGGSGIEVMSGSQDPSQANYFSKLAASLDLFSSCGSDFHGKGISHRALGNISQLPDNSIPIWTKWEILRKFFH
jgi:predicted metal-dependent phosphoesterase TrpH